MDTLCYLGTLDDVVQTYPWRFKVDFQSLNHSLMVNLIQGRHVLLNDGYLVNHPLGQEALVGNKQGNKTLLRHMIEKGQVVVLSRGGTDYGLHQMPEIMAKQNNESFQRLVMDKNPKNPPWRKLKAQLHLIDGELRYDGLIGNWPSYDIGAGFKLLAEKLLKEKATPLSLGIHKHVKQFVLEDFLKNYLERMNKDTRGARDYWEKLAMNFSLNPDYTDDQGRFVRSMMNLANEIYHYNMGVMLSADRDEVVAIETGFSAAFDDLLMSPKRSISEKPPLLNVKVPKSLIKIPPSDIIGIINEGTKVGDARKEWIKVKREAEIAYSKNEAYDEKQVKDASKKYTMELAAHLGSKINRDKTEWLFELVIGSGLNAAAGATAGAFIGEPEIGAGMGLAAGALYTVVLALGQTHLSKIATKKYAIKETELKMKHSVGAQKVQGKFLKMLNRGAVLSSMEIDKTVAHSIASTIPRFKFNA